MKGHSWIIIIQFSKLSVIKLGNLCDNARSPVFHTYVRLLAYMEHCDDDKCSDRHVYSMCLIRSNIAGEEGHFYQLVRRTSELSVEYRVSTCSVSSSVDKQQKLLLPISPCMLIIIINLRYQLTYYPNIDICSIALNWFLFISPYKM